MSNLGQSSNTGCSWTTLAYLRNAESTGLSADSQGLNDNFLKLRAVLILRAAPHGSKTSTARTLAMELQGRNLKASFRSLYFWQKNYLRAGFAGIPRRRRSDRGRPQGFGAEILARIVDASTRVHRHGDLSREFRGGGFHSSMTSETFRVWIRRIQRRLRIIEMPTREEPIALLF